MSVDKVSEYKSFAPGLGDNQLLPKIDREKNTEGKIAPTEENEAAISASSATQSTVETDTTSAAAESDNSVVLERLKSINEQFPIKATSLIFEFDDTNEPPVVKVVDKESGELIRELPPKELREIAKAFSDIADNLNGGTGKLQDKLSSGILIDERS